MNIGAIDSSVNPTLPSKQSSNDELRTIAKQFEAIMLTQLTSALSSSESDEDSLFGSDAGSGLAKQMFSEQLAKTMAESGGVGLADLIMQKFGAQETKQTRLNEKFSGALNAVKEIKNQKNLSGFTGNPNDFEVISTYADDILNDRFAEPLANAMLDGKIRDSTRPRIVPENSNSEKMILTPVNPVVNLFGATTSTQYEMPLEGRISSNFGTRFHPIDKVSKFHAGVDIAVPRGTSVGAAADGTVTFAGQKGGYGNVVIVEHADGHTTFYAHCDKLLVKEGQTVTVGEEIAKSGSTGKSTGPHLHFEVRENGKPIDPLKFLSNVLPKTAER
jgi:murein DD-endopeptidase MepM/ murein hydrolase activator NlpD